MSNDSNVIPLQFSERSTLANVNVKKAKGVDFSEIGLSGIKRFNGTLYEEFLQNLQGQQGIAVYTEMRDNDAIIGAVLLAIEQVIRKTSWFIDPATNDNEGLKAAEFLSSCMTDMSHTWQDFITDVLSMLSYGWAWMEVVYKLRKGDVVDPRGNSRYSDGNVGWRKIALRKQNTLSEWEFDENDGGIRAMIQMPPPHYDVRRIPIEKSLLFRVKGEGNNPEGRSILRNAYRCYSADTEVLTIDGWKLLSSVSFNDEIATLSHETKQLMYQNPIDIMQYDYSGKMFLQQGRFLDLCVTPNHKMYVRKINRSDFEFIEAQDLGRTVAYKRDAEWKGEEQENFVLPELEYTQKVRSGTYEYEDERTFKLPQRTVPMDSWLEYFGYFIAEGSVYRKQEGTKQCFIDIIQKDPLVVNRITDVAKLCGFNPCVSEQYFVSDDDDEDELVPDNCARIQISNLQLYTYLLQFGKCDQKFIPKEIKALSKRQLRILFNALMQGDGTYMGGDEYNDGTPIYYTTSRQLAEDVFEIMLKIGYSPNMRMQSRKYSFGKKPVYLVSGNKVVEGGNKVGVQGDTRQWVDYNGKVHCLEVPNHIIYVRRNGKACWCGNSWYLKKSFEMLEAIGAERDLIGLPVITPPDGFDVQSAENASIRRYIHRLIANLRRDEQEGVFLPPGFKIELLSSGNSRRQFDLDKIINRCDKRLAISVLAQFIMLGMDRVGSFALSKSSDDVFLVSVQGYLDNISSVLNAYAAPRLFAQNPEFSYVVKSGKYPRFTPGRVTEPNLADLGAYISGLVKVGCIRPTKGMEKELRRIGGMDAQWTRETGAVQEQEGDDNSELLPPPLPTVAATTTTTPTVRKPVQQGQG